MGEIRHFFYSIYAVDSIWSVVFRGGLWFVIAAIIIINSDSPHPEHSAKKLKSNLGFFLLFITLSSGLMFLLFGFTPSASQ